MTGRDGVELTCQRKLSLRMCQKMKPGKSTGGVLCALTSLHFPIVSKTGMLYLWGKDERNSGRLIVLFVMPEINQLTQNGF